MTEKIRACELIFDETLYPRRMVDRLNVERIKDALEAGRRLPPIDVDRASKRIVDGIHRWKAAQEVSGTEAEIEIEWHNYATENDIRLAAMELNSAHGRPLSEFEIAICIKVGREHKISVEKLAKALGLTLARLREITDERTAHVNGDTVVLKKTVRHLVGSTITHEQSEYASRLGGRPAIYYINQVVCLLEGDLIDATNEAVAERLHHLAKLLEKYIGVAV